MELLQLKYFCDAAVTENFSRTAAKFFVPTSNISQSIKRLEKELGTELFEHRTNKVLLSDAGKRFYEKVNNALNILDEAKNELTESGDEISGEVKIMILCNRQTVTSAIECFKTVHPQVNFVIWHGKESNIAPDIVISDICPEDYVASFLLSKEDILLAMSKEHPFANESEISVSSLKSERFITMAKGKSLYNLTFDICRSGGFIPNISIQSDDPYYVRKYVELGLGIAFVPELSWKGLFSENVILKKAGGYTRNTYVCLPEKQKQRPAASEFLQYLLSLKRK